MARRTGQRVTVELLKKGDDDNEESRSIRSNMFRSTAEELGLTPVDPFVKKEDGKYSIRRGGRDVAYKLVYKPDNKPDDNKSGEVSVPVSGNVTIVDFFEFVNETLSDKKSDFGQIITPQGIAYGVTDINEESDGVGVNTPDAEEISE